MNFKSILNEWLCENIDKKIPLFDTDDGKIKTEIYKETRIIKVSNEFKEYFQMKSKLINESSDCIGFIYIMYFIENNLLIPLYIGRAEKKNGKIMLFQRWLRNKNSDHMFLFSKVVLEGLTKPEKYKKWQNHLIERNKFKNNVLFAIIPWYTNSDLIFIKEKVPIKTAEFLLIGLAGEAFPEEILNSEGISREGIYKIDDINNIIPFQKLEELWDFWINKYIKNNIPLFDEKEGIVSTTMSGRFKVLKRSREMEELIEKEVQNVYNDYLPVDKKEFYGVIYIMYTMQENKIIPLYVGKAEKLGRNGEYSVNLKAVHRGLNKAKFARWGYGHAYHIGDLSMAVLQGTEDRHECYQKKPPEKYIRWKNMLFDDNELNQGRIKLKTNLPIYFWMKAWHKNDIGLFSLAHCSCTFLEYQLIGVSGLIFKDYILNTEGI
ncbi:MAG: hypothetical protein ACFE8A_12420 [Candidatus Hodarchaeota archaeon]